MTDETMEKTIHLKPARLLTCLLIIITIAGFSGLSLAREQQKAEKLQTTRTEKMATLQSWENEIFYQIFTRSFYDSDGDSIGDFAGIRQKLDYLKHLGITGIWLTPIFPSRTYHNYFADSFDSTYDRFGANSDFFALVKAVHKKKMKIFIDMETQYVADQHPWYQLSKGNPASPYSQFLRYRDSTNTDPGLWKQATTYDARHIPLLNVNLNNAALLEEQKRIYSYWMDPNHDVRFDDGVDGFRIDHMMDNLDDKGESIHLDSTFWKPLFAHLRSINPRMFILAEQSDWGYGSDQLSNGDADAAFTIPLLFDLAAWNKAKILNDLNTELSVTPKGKYQFTVIENHDVNRFASSIKGNPVKLRIGAVVNMTVKGVPCLYYGQELGMEGVKGKWGTDGNDIPLRQAFRWHRNIAGKGMALWYANSGPWWDSSGTHDSDGISLEEQIGDSNSLWNFYRKIIAIRQSNPALRNGDITILPNDNDSVLSYARSYNAGSRKQTIGVIINLSDTTQRVTIDLNSLKLREKAIRLIDMIDHRKLTTIDSRNAQSYTLNLAQYEIVMAELLHK
jgi:alpha-amylase